MAESGRQAQIRENDRLQKGIDTVEADLKDLKGTFEDHVVKTMERDRVLSLDLQEIKLTGQQTLDQTVRTNGSVAQHERRLNEITPIIDSLAEESKRRTANDSTRWRFWWEWGIRVGLVILGIVLMKTGVINVPLW